MVYGAIDRHLRYSWIRVIDETGQVRRHRRVRTSAEPLIAAFGGLGAIRILLESGTDSEWVAQTLEASGAEVIVADPNFAPMYGERHRKVKTDERDVIALAEANRRGWYRAAYRGSAEQRARRQHLLVRRQLVAARTGAISVIRAVLRQAGHRVGGGSSETLPARVSALALPPALRETIAPMTRMVLTLTAEIGALDRQLSAAAAADPVVRRLQTVPGVGVIVALTFRAFVDDVTR